MPRPTTANPIFQAGVNQLMRERARLEAENLIRQCEETLKCFSTISEIKRLQLQRRIAALLEYSALPNGSIDLQGRSARFSQTHPVRLNVDIASGSAIKEKRLTGKAVLKNGKTFFFDVPYPALRNPDGSMSK